MASLLAGYEDTSSDEEDSSSEESPSTQKQKPRLSAASILKEAAKDAASWLEKTPVAVIKEIKPVKEEKEPFSIPVPPKKAPMPVGKPQEPAESPANVLRRLSRKKRGADRMGKAVDSKAKDRVKNQRMKGQSGIGSDFRVWRTDAEMKLRQSFD